MHLMSGCEGTTRAFRSNVMRMILLSTAGVRSKPAGCGTWWRSGFLNAGWNFILIRRRWSIVRMIREVTIIPTRSLTFWGLRFGLGWQSSMKGNMGLASAQRWVRKQPKPCDAPSGAGESIGRVIRVFLIYHRCLIRFSVDGSITTAVTTSQPSIPFVTN